MGSVVEYYVDPNLSSDTGDGSLLTPWGRADTECVQHALNTITRGASGDRINIKVGAGARDIVPTLGYDITGTYGIPDIDQPLYIQGYTTAAGDGGFGGVDLDANVMFAQATTIDFVNLWGLDITDLNGTPGTPTTSIQLDRDILIRNCAIHGLTPATNVVKLASGCHFLNNHVYNCTGNGIAEGVQNIAGNRFITGPTNNFGTAAISGLGGNVYALENIIHVAGATDGIGTGNRNAIVVNNSIFSDGGTGVGIEFSSVTKGGIVLNNLVEGFSGAGGIGIRLRSSPGDLVFDGNAVYDNTTEYTIDNTGPNEGTNETLSASPFTDAANDDFSPVDTGNVKEGSKPGFIGTF